jgi:NADPH-dependent ferric siderophore reductase
MTEQRHRRSRGIRGAVFRLLGTSDFRLTVTHRTDLTRHYTRVGFAAPELLTERQVFPTMWARLWFAQGQRSTPRAYTLINPDPTAGTVDIEFALHDGPASRWARRARPGDVVEATVPGTRRFEPDHAADGHVIVGDTASLPAVNSLLAALGDGPARVFLEWQHADDRELPVAAAPEADVVRVPRERAGAALVETVERAAFDARGYAAWVACDSLTTRTVTGVLQRRYHIERAAITAKGYWVPS